MSEFRYKVEGLVADAGEGIREIFRRVANCKMTKIHPVADHSVTEDMESENIQGPNLGAEIEENRESSS